MIFFTRFLSICAVSLFLIASMANAAIVDHSGSATEQTLNLTLRSDSLYAYRRVYIDSDMKEATGFRQNGIGAEYVIVNQYLYRYTGNGSNWSWYYVSQIQTRTSSSETKWTLSRSAINWNSTTRNIGVLFQQENVGRPIETSAASMLTSHAIDSVNQVLNPERGFYRDFGANCESYALTKSLLDSIKGQGVTLLMCRINLASFLNKPIIPAALSRLNANFKAIRDAGMKMILRPSYSIDDSVPVSSRNATKAWILYHIYQLKPVLQANADVIFTLQAGFIGVYGEWWITTSEFGDGGVVSPVQLANRKAIVDALLAALPASKSIGIRTPRYKRAMYGTSPLASSEAFTGTARARIGHFNDCFLSSTTDTGTYVSVVEEKNYLAAETRFVPIGGESCKYSSFSGWPNALADMTRLKFTYLNDGYFPQVLKGWGAKIDEAKRRLGYRLSVTSTFVPVSAARSGMLKARIDMLNVGFAAPSSQRNVQLVLRHRTTGEVRRFPLAVDPRTWQPTTPIRIDANVPLGAVPVGTYDLGLALPDAAPSLASRADYAIRLANPGVWQATSGINNLGVAVAIR